MSKMRLLSPFCALSCNQSSSLFSGLLCRLRYSPVECPSNKFYGINCRPKLGTKLLNRFFHRRRQVSPPVNRLTHCFFDGCYHLIDGDVAVGLCHSLAPLFSSATAETTSARMRHARLRSTLPNVPGKRCRAHRVRARRRAGSCSWSRHSNIQCRC